MAGDNSRDSTSPAYSRLAWSAPLAILGGTAICLPRFVGPDVLEFLGYSAIAVIAAVLMALSIGRQRVATPLRWIVLAEFLVAYFAQLWWMLLDPNYGLAVSSLFLEALEDDLLVVTLRYVSLSFLAASLTATLMDVIPQQDRKPPTLTPVGARLASGRAFTVAMLLTIAVVPIAIVLGVGVVGSDAGLPFHIAGILQNIQLSVIPALLLLSVYAAEIGGDKNRSRIAVATLMTLAVSTVLVTSSKAPLIFAIASTFFLFSFIGRMSKRIITATVAAAAVFVMIYPLFWALRDSKKSSEAEVATLSRAIESDWQSAGLLASARGVAFRAVGFEMLATLISQEVKLEAHELPSALGGNVNISALVTKEVFGFAPTDAIGIAPSLLGWLYVALGPDWMIFGLVVFLVATEGVWRWLARMRLTTRPVVQALFASSFLLVCNEGTLDGRLIFSAVFVATAAGMEFVATFGAGFASPEA